MSIARALVRTWSDEEGWGVLDSDETPGGCWVHFSSIAGDGYRFLEPGQGVEVEWEHADQDGFAHRAVCVAPAGGLVT